MENSCRGQLLLTVKTALLPTWRHRYKTTKNKVQKIFVKVKMFHKSVARKELLLRGHSNL